MPVENQIRLRAVRPLERMNSPLEIRKVRLRGLGGQAMCGVGRTCASATGDYRITFAIGIIRPLEVDAELEAFDAEALAEVEAVRPLARGP